MITDGKKWHYLALKNGRTDGYNRPVKRLSKLHQTIRDIFIAWVVCIHFAQVMCLKNMKDYVLNMVTLI